jgi:hypothetical protein
MAEGSKVGRHLLRHELTSNVRRAAVVALGDDADEAGHTILRLRCARCKSFLNQP